MVCAARATPVSIATPIAYSFAGMNETVDLSKVEGCNNSRWCGVLSVPDATLNPLAYDWNFVFLYYCDGGSFTGQTMEGVGQFHRSDNGGCVSFRMLACILSATASNATAGTIGASNIGAS